MARPGIKSRFLVASVIFVQILLRNPTLKLRVRVHLTRIIIRRVILILQEPEIQTQPEAQILRAIIRQIQAQQVLRLKAVMSSAVRRQALNQA